MKKIIRNFFIRAYQHFETLSRKKEYANFKLKYKIDDSVRFNGKNIRLYGEGQIVIEKDSYIGEQSYLQSSENQIIKIGTNCAISHNVKMYTCSYVADQNFIQKDRSQYYGSIDIGNGVWIGVNVYIGPGITIGDNAVIGANSVVTSNVPENAIFGGIPAKLIRYKSC